MSISVVYMLPMLLGKTYDLGTDTPGVQIFKQTDLDDAQVISHHSTDIRYQLVDSNTQRRDMLGISGRLALKIKAGMINVAGSGDYLKDSSSKANSVELLARVTYRSVTKTLSTQTPPIPDWMSRYDKSLLGTHYARSITYGAELIASLTFTARNSYSLQDIKAAVEGAVRTGTVSLDVKGNLKMLQDSLTDKVSTQISYYATVPLGGVAHNLESLHQLIDTFGDQVQATPGGLGVPVSMELYPLESLHAQRFGTSFMLDAALQSRLNLLEDRFDDLLRTKKVISYYYADQLPPIVPEAIHKKLSKLKQDVTSVLDAFYEVIENLDFSNYEQGRTLMDKAYKAYKMGGAGVPHKFFRAFRKLRKELIFTYPEAKLPGSGAVYTHWGQKKCRKEGTTLAAQGRVAVPKAGSEIVCLPEPAGSEESGSSYAGEMRWLGLDCARCLAERASSSVVLPAARDCPGGWVKEYEGVLTASQDRSAPSTFVCLDVKAQLPPVQDSSRATISLAPVTFECGILPCKQYQQNQQIPCVVCTQ